MKHTLLGAGLALSFASSLASADIIGATVGVEQWSQDWSGTIQQGTTQVDLQDDMKLDKDQGMVIYAAFEHPIPLLPNVMVRATSMETEGSNTLTRNFDYNGSSYDSGKALATDLNLSHTDVTAYYEILDNWVNLDLGLTLRKISGFVEFEQDNVSKRENISGTVPMAFANARFNLPFSGFYAKAMGNLISFDGDTVTDFTAGVGYEAYIVSAELGFRQQAYSIDRSFLEADMDISGPYLSINIDI